MSYKRKGQLTPSPEWAKHLRPFWKKIFWKRERKAEEKLTKSELKRIRVQKDQCMFCGHTNEDREPGEPCVNCIALNVMKNHELTLKKLAAYDKGVCVYCGTEIKNENFETVCASCKELREQ